MAPTLQTILDSCAKLDAECYGIADAARNSVSMSGFPDTLSGMGSWIKASRAAFDEARSRAVSQRAALYAQLHADCVSLGGHAYEGDACVVCGHDRTSAFERATVRSNVLKVR